MIFEGLGDAGVVHERIDPAEIGEDRRDHCTTTISVSHVAGVTPVTAAGQGVRRKASRRLIEVEDGDCRPMFGEKPGDGASDAPIRCGSGDKADAISEKHLVAPPLRSSGAFRGRR